MLLEQVKVGQIIRIRYIQEFELTNYLLVLKKYVDGIKWYDVESGKIGRMPFDHDYQSVYKIIIELVNDTA